MKYSIIVPIYNAEKYIEKCLISIKNQSYKDLEIIIVNDGSNDKTLEKIGENINNDERFKVINIPNAGVSNARNIGMKESTGDYITFIDADDYIECNTFEKINKILENENIDILKYGYIKEYGKIRKKYKFLCDANKKIGCEEYKNKVFQSILNNNDFGNVWNMIIKKELINDVWFDINKKYAEDRKYSYQVISRSSNIYILDVPLYHYVFNKGSAMNTKGTSQLITKLYNAIDTNMYIYKSILKQFKVNLKEKLIESILDDMLNFIEKSTRKCSYTQYKQVVNNIISNSQINNVILELGEDTVKYINEVLSSKKSFKKLVSRKIMSKIKQIIKGAI